MNSQNIKRNTVFIQKRFQLRSMLTVVGIIAASGVLSGVLLYFILSSELGSDLNAAHLQIQNVWDSLASAIVFGNTVTILITGMVASIAVLYQSHKIAGPMYRLQTLCKEVSQGNYNAVSSLRKADQLTELAASFDDMLQALRNKNKQKNEVIITIQESLILLTESSDENKQKTLLADIKEKLNQLR